MPGGYHWPRQNHRRGLDRWLIGLTAAFLTFGLVTLTSVSSAVAYQNYNDGYYFVKRQALAMVIGLLLFYILSRWPAERLKKLSFWLLLLNVVLLLVVLFVGRSVNGSRAWIPLFGFNLQPSEILKITFILYLANRLSDKRLGNRQKLLAFLAIYAVLAVLIMLQPDMGTLFVISLAAGVSLLVAGLPWRYLFGLAGVALLVMTVLVAVSSYQQYRFRCLLDPGFSPRDRCYQLNQSLIAIGSGGFWGRGLGESRQKFLYLPEVQNDFIFSVTTEEVGFLFGGLLIICYGLLFFRAYATAKAASDPFVRIGTMALAGAIVFQAILNLGGVMRFLPLTGVPLPFISYGGSAIITDLAALGILAGFSRET